MRIHARIIGGLLVTTLVTQLSACGTLFYPDRRGQINGRIDPVVAALNTVGLLFFVIPGLIAFGIDFTTGAIYLPNKRVAQLNPQDLQKVLDSSGNIDREQLQALVREKTGHDLPLNDPRLQQQQINDMQLATHTWQPSA